jgi:hypothetical protein
MDVATLTDLWGGRGGPGTTKRLLRSTHPVGVVAAYINAREQGSTPGEASNDAALYMEGVR